MNATNDTRLLVVSCPKREAIQEIWRRCFAQNWPDCPYPVDMLSPTPDLGWNENLQRYLWVIEAEFILLLLDDHFIDPSDSANYTANIEKLLGIMRAHPGIGMCKLQAGNSWSPEVPFRPWDRLREYDRRHHPFKRTNLVPTLFRHRFLLRLSQAVLAYCGVNRDQGRQGALEFEVAGTLLTEDVVAWPERILGIHRPNDDVGTNSLLSCIANDGVREGRLQVTSDELGFDALAVPGIVTFL